MFMVDWISTEDRDNGRVMWKQQWIVGLHEVQGIYWRDEELLAFQEIHAVNQLLGYIKREDGSCANVVRSTIEGTAAPPCSSTWAAGTTNWRCLTSEQCCHLSTVASCPLSCVSVSIVCRCSRCVFWHLHTVPIELLMSSTSVWLTRIGGRWRQVRFLESDCLELLLMQAAQNNGLTDGMKREMLQEVTYM